MSREDNPYVTHRECSRQVGQITTQINNLQDEIRVIKEALVGKDLRGGVVKDVADIKSKISFWSGVKTIVVSIGVAVVSAVITAWAIGILHP